MVRITTIKPMHNPFLDYWARIWIPPAPNRRAARARTLPQRRYHYGRHLCRKVRRYLGGTPSNESGTVSVEFTYDRE